MVSDEKESEEVIARLFEDIPLKPWNDGNVLNEVNFIITKM